MQIFFLFLNPADIKLCIDLLKLLLHLSTFQQAVALSVVSNVYFSPLLQNYKAQTYYTTFLTKICLRISDWW